MDFTFKTYENLLNTLLARGFSFMTFAQYIETKSQQPIANSQKLIILRHDVEARYPNALRMAQIQHKLGIKGSYYFRIFPKPGNEKIIKQIAALGHEIGYHYDDLSVCNGNHQKALQRFQKNLTYLRQFAPVTTITMEGAPLSKYDNRNLWESSTNQQFSNLHILNKSTNQQINKSTVPQPHYSNYAILAEPYFDLNFNEIFYLTDTGRCWDGHLYNLRDKATKENPITNLHFLKLRFHTTFDLINAIEATPQHTNNLPANSLYPERSRREQPIANSFPTHAMLNFHPQRWNDKPLPWLKELFWQNVKNQGKRMLLRFRK